MDDINDLVRKRGIIKAQLTRLEKHFDLFTPDKRFQLESRLDRCDDWWKEFQLIQFQIEKLDNSDRRQDERIVFEEHFHNVISEAKRLLTECSVDKSPTGSVGGLPGAARASFTLAPIDIPKFDGSYQNWIGFRDGFHTMVDSNPNLSLFQKFVYLKGSLTGVAADLLENLAITDENYKDALDLLKLEYENKKIIAYSHLEAFDSFPVITKESHESLSKFVTEIRKNIRGLKNLGQNVDEWDTYLIFHLQKKLDFNSKRAWKQHLGVDEFPTVEQFLDFLSHRAKLLEPEKIELNKSSAQNKHFHGKGVQNKNHFGTKTFVATGVEEKKCVICKSEPHLIYFCKKFLGLSLSAKRNEINKNNLCWNCLKSGHRVQNCNSRGCRHCSKKHHSLLHEERNNQSLTKENGNELVSKSSGGNLEKRDSSSEGTTHTFFINGLGSGVLLSTAVVDIADNDGNAHQCRALLDSGSQSSFMTRELSNRLQLPLKSANTSVLGIGQGLLNVGHYVNTKIRSRFNNRSFNTSFLVIDSISEEVPCCSLDGNFINIPKDIILADSNFAKSGKVDLLLGSGLFWDLIDGEQRKLGPGKPLLQKTQLGWIVAGPYGGTGNEFNKRLVENCLLVSNKAVMEQLEKFWKIEELPVERRFSKEEQACEDIFQETIFRENGRFVVTLPVKQGMELGKSFEMAYKRFGHLEKRLTGNEVLKEHYSAFMEEYNKLGHMTKIREFNDLRSGKLLENNFNFLPHHGVFREHAATTKLRVVFDASANTDNGVSLNNILMVGPKLQEDLFNVLLRFRKYQVVMTADVEKMYRQVLVKEDQRRLQCILWRSSEAEPIGVFKLNTVTYGTAPASYLAVRALQQLAYDFGQECPEVSKVILKDFYMDDLLTGADNENDAKRMKQQISKILESGGFVLRKWSSNRKGILTRDGDDLCRDITEGIDHYIFDGKKDHKTLGLYWDSDEDSWHFKVHIKGDSRSTKRLILSAVAQIFDPLGLLGPVVLRAKIFLQTLWKEKLAWDEDIPLKLKTSWVQFRSNLENLSDIKIVRRVICENPRAVEIHCFCDASQLAYGAAIYIRSTDLRGSHIISLLCSKSRVAPIKVVSLPRLELCGALLGARLTTEVIAAMDILPSKVFFWSDSTIVLSWLRGDPSQWKVFVSNRVAEIQRLTGEYQWYHVKSEDNPADLVSRGIGPELLKDCSMWWNGPSWLSREIACWPLKEHGCPEEVPDRKVVQQSFLVNGTNELLSKFSSFIKLERVVAYCSRFVNNCRNKRQTIGMLTADELKVSEKLIVKLCQRESFHSEILDLERNRLISRNSKLLSLNPFLDKENLLRVGGRLHNSNLSFSQRHPLILPSHNRITKLLIKREHYRNLHAGPQALLAIIRHKYWPLSGLNTVKQVLRNCAVCFRVKPKLSEQIMGNLPQDRITPARPFTNCGTDFGGPFEIKIYKTRGNKLIKAYMCIFVCFATKAVHIEVVGDLSTNAFLNCFKRFISRRGLPVNVYSDNATNYVGANNSLNELYKFLKRKETQGVFEEYFSNERIRWHFIPARSPHFGGLWESVIKAAKYHLKRVIGNQKLTYEEFHTLLTQVEACLNSRPLFPLTENPDDLNILTPGHFLIGTALRAMPQEDYSEVNPGRLKRFELLTQMYQHFWNRWARDYLTQLQQRSKWRRLKDNIKVGDLVILKEDNLPPMRWQLARVQALHLGNDNQCRVVSVKTSRGVVKRAINRLCVLPNDDDLNN